MKKIFLTILFIFFLFFLVIFSNTNLIAAKEGSILWANCIIPSLFPFFIATELLNYTDITKIVGNMMHRIMRPLFNVPGVAAYALIMGLVSGSPIGAKITLDLYENNLVTKKEAERMLAFTNNCGPLFIIGTTGILLFHSKLIGILLLSTHILSSITTGIILGIQSRMNNVRTEISTRNHYNESISTNYDYNIGIILSQSVKNAVSLTLQIGGFIVLFSVFLSIINELNIFNAIGSILEKIYIPKEFTKSILTGMIELTSGVNIVANLQTQYLSMNIIICSFLLGFGGISILIQVMSILSKSNLSIKTYLTGKLLHGLLAALYTAIFIQIEPIFQLDIIK